MKRLEIITRSGSPQHYYHFLLGFCVPLVDYCLENKGPVLVRDCGPMNLMLSELRLDITTTTKVNSCSPYIHGMDSVPFYDLKAFQRFREHLQPFVRSYLEPTSVLLIERGDPLPFYGSEQSDAFSDKDPLMKTSGTGRCAIRNHREVEAILRLKIPSFANVHLDNCALVEQYGLFHGADVVIAQHGAALANILFMRPGTKVIEIGPLRYEKNYYSELARTLGIEYHLIDADEPFPALDPQRILDLL
jgi:hypothetical protein